MRMENLSSLVSGVAVILIVSIHHTKKGKRMVKNEALIELTGWLNDVREFDWGTALKVSVDVRKKTPEGTWETVDKTVYDVTTDGKTPLEDVKQVTVKGRITGTNTFQKRDGSTGAAVKVRAESIVIASDKREEAAVHEVWPTVNPNQAITESAPF
jgi:hypothetical protein